MPSIFAVRPGARVPCRCPGVPGCTGVPGCPGVPGGAQGCPEVPQGARVPRGARVLYSPIAL
eukprot:4719254-Pyramimonas_sp.AAC.1